MGDRPVPTKILFVCSENRLRSPTAATVFSDFEDVEAVSAGTNKDCETPISGDLIQWADVILVMEQAHKKKVAKQFRSLLRDKKLAVLDIPDAFEYMDPMLIALLKARVTRHVSIS